MKVIIAVIGASIALVVQAVPGFAISNSVKTACMGDYFSYCSSHAVGSPALRACMNDNGHRLSRRCVRALVSAGQVSTSEVARRSANAAR